MNKYAELRDEYLALQRAHKKIKTALDLHYSDNPECYAVMEDAARLLKSIIDHHKSLHNKDTFPHLVKG